MGDRTFKNYLHDLGTLIKENAKEAKKQKDSSIGSSSQDYNSGYLMAWYEIVSLMQQQAEAFGIPFEALDLHDIDPDKDLFRSGNEPITTVSESTDMDILKQVKEILEQQNPQEKDNLLEQLSDVLEYNHGLNEVDVVEGTRLLLAAALQEDDKVLRKEFFHTIDQSVVYQEIGDRINWDPLVVSLASLEKRDLVYVLDILGLSGQRKYLSLLDKYAHHSDPEIRQWAHEAIEDLEDSIVHATDSQKAG
jgi:hypothetical protein